MTGTVVNFYSPRGELGRGIALANAGWMLAERGNLVLAIDWNLEMPDLPGHFGDFVEKDARYPGIVEVLKELSASGRPAAEAVAMSLSEAIIPLQRFGTAGRIDLLPAGQLGAARDEIPSAEVISAIRAELLHRYDYVLVDCRKGGTNPVLGSLAIPPDLIVLCLTAARSNLDSAVIATQRIRDKVNSDPLYGQRSVRILPVLFRAEINDARRIAEARRDLGQAFGRLFNLSADQIQKYQPAVELPGGSTSVEGIVTRAAQASPQLEALKAGYSRLAQELIDHERAGHLLNGGGPPSEKVDVDVDALISYAAADQLWAEWLEDQLSADGLRVNRHCVDQDLVDQVDIIGVENPPKTVVFLQSSNYAETSLATNVTACAAAPDQPRTVVIRIDRTSSSLPSGNHSTEDFSDLSASEAATAVDRVFGLKSGASRTSSRWLSRHPRPTDIHRSNLPPRNDDFTGRVGLLNTLRGNLTSESAPAPQVLFGQAGVGKTSIALEYAHRYAADYDVVWWIPAETYVLAESGLFDLAENMDIQDGDESAVVRLLASMRRRDTDARWLIVFDSADNPADLHGLIPDCNGHVLITSRRDDWGGVDSPVAPEVVEVDVFDRAEAAAYLHKSIPSLTETEALDLARQFGDLPLAVTQAVKYLKATDATVKHYLKLIDEQPSIPGLEAEHGGQKVAAAWLVALDQLSIAAPAAARMFEVLTCLAPEAIPEQVYFADVMISAIAEVDPMVADRNRRAALTSRIEQLGLAQVDRLTRQLTIHRLVRTVVRDQDPGGRRSANRALAFQALAHANPGTPDDHEAWDVYHGLWPHMASPGLFDSDDTGVRQLIVDLIRYRYKHGDYKGVEELTKEVIAHWTGGGGADDLLTLQAKVQLANALRRMGHFEESRGLDQDAVDKLSVLDGIGPDDVYTLQAESGLAADLRALGEYDDALRRDQHVYDRYRAVIGAVDEKALNFQSNLAISHRVLGDPQRAGELDRQAYEGRRHVLGENHPYTAYSASGYGRDLRDLGRFEESRRWLELAHDTYVRSLGPDHPDTLRAAKNLAVTWRRLAEFEQANRLAEETLRMSNARLGPEHTDSLLVLMTLATVYSARDLHDRARMAGERAVRGLTKVLGPNHVYTLLARSNLAAIELRSQPPIVRDTELQSVLTKLREMLHEGHWVLEVVALNLANHLAAAGQGLEALFLSERTYERMRDRFGPDHNDVLSAQINLAISLKEANERERSLETMNEVKRHETGLSPTHPRVIAAKNWTRWTFIFVDPPPLA